MAKLRYSAITSLDGYVADRDGKFDWAAPDEDVHAFVNDLERPVGTYLYGRRMYDVMAYWETAHEIADQRAVSRDYTEIWQSAEKVVFSSSLPDVSTARTTLQRQFDADTIRQLKETADRDISIGGPTLAAHALRAGLVDECNFFLNPIAVGAGLAAFPDDLHVPLELLGEHRFASGVVHLHYRVTEF
jgi:dihydrofolate reductase